LLSAAEHFVFDEDDVEALRLGEEALAHFRTLDDERGTADALRIVAAALRLKACREDREPDEAEELVKEELAKFKESGSKTGQASMLLALSEITALRKVPRDREMALKQGKEALAIYSSLEDEKMRAATLIGILRTQLSLKLFVEAIATANAALEIYTALEDRKGQGIAVYNLAVANSLSYQHEAAMEAARQALGIFDGCGAKRLSAKMQHAMANWLLDQSQDQIKAQEALMHLKLILANAKELWFQSLKPKVVATAVQAHSANKETDLAVKLAKKSLAEHRAGARLDDYQEQEVDYLDLLADTLLLAEDPEAALSRAEEANSLAKELKDRKREGRTLLTIAQSYIDRKQYADAIATCREAEAVYKSAGDLKGEAEALILKVQVLLDQEKVDDAMIPAKRAKDLYCKAFDRHSEARALTVLASLHRFQMEDCEAAGHLSEAQFLFSKEKDLRWEAKVLFDLAEIYQGVQKYKKSLRAVTKALGFFRDLGDRTSQASCLCMIANIQNAFLVNHALEKAVQPKEADEVFKAIKEAKDFCIALKEKRLIASMAFTEAQVHMLMRMSADAMNSIEEAELLCKECGEAEGEPLGLVLTAKVALLEGRIPEAVEINDKALTLSKAVKSERCEFLAQNLKDLLSTQLGDSTGDQAASAGSQVGTAEEELKIDPEILRLKINDVAMSLIGIASVQGDIPLMDAGLDSLSMVEFRNELCKEFPGVEMPGAMLFDYPTVNALVEFIKESLDAVHGNAKLAD